MTESPIPLPGDLLAQWNAALESAGILPDHVARLAQAGHFIVPLRLDARLGDTAIDVRVYTMALERAAAIERELAALRALVNPELNLQAGSDIARPSAVSDPVRKEPP